MDRLAHFTINVNHIAGEHSALTDYMSRNPSAPPQTDEAYVEEYVINNIIPHYISPPNAVASATTSTNQNAKWSKTKAKKIINRVHKTRANKLPLIALTAQL